MLYWLPFGIFLAASLSVAFVNNYNKNIFYNKFVVTVAIYILLLFLICIYIAVMSLLRTKPQPNPKPRYLMKQELTDESKQKLSSVVLDASLHMERQTPPSLPSRNIIRPISTRISSGNHFIISLYIRVKKECICLYIAIRIRFVIVMYFRLELKRTFC